MTNPQHDPRVMDIYTLAVEMADRLSTRRATANTFFLTVNTALVAVVGLAKEPLGTLSSVAVCSAGIAVSWSWWLLLRVYRRLNHAKFAVITQIEAQYLPVKPFTDEWAHMTRQPSGPGRIGYHRNVFRDLGGVERVVPILFGVIYLVLLIAEL